MQIYQITASQGIYGNINYILLHKQERWQHEVVSVSKIIILFHCPLDGERFKNLRLLEKHEFVLAILNSL